MITHRTLGGLATQDQIANALRDLEIERQQIVAALNLMLAAAPTGEFRLILVDDAGQPAQYEMIAGAGMTITPDAVTKTVTFTSP